MTNKCAGCQDLPEDVVAILKGNPEEALGPIQTREVGKPDRRNSDVLRTVRRLSDKAKARLRKT